MKIEDLTALANYLNEINKMASEYRESHKEDYTLYFFKRPHQRTSDFCAELADLVSNLSPELIDYKKLESNAKYKNKIGEIILDLESDLEWFKNAPHIDEKTKKLCVEAIAKIKEIEKEMGIEKKTGLEIKS